MTETLFGDSARVTGSSLLVFVDETGDESLRDPAYRVFVPQAHALRCVGVSLVVEFTFTRATG